MTFEQALAEMRKGKAVKIYGWDFGVKIYQSKWGDTIMETHTYTYPYRLTCCDILSDDWEIVDNDSEDCR